MLIFPCIFASSDQIANRLVRRRGNPNRRQIASTVAARQLLGIAAIRFDPVSGFDRDQRRRDYFTG